MPRTPARPIPRALASAAATTPARPIPRALALASVAAAAAAATLACGRASDPPAPAPAPAPVQAGPAPEAAAAASADAEPSPNRITFSVRDKHHGPVLAVRCRLAGDPLDVDCGDGSSIALDGDGRLYATDQGGVRRYTVATATAEACELSRDPAFGTGGVLAHPAIAPPPQPLGAGPVYMSSGGPRWQVAAGAGTAMYYFELLRGVHRIDRGKVAPVCPRLQGVSGLAVRGKAANVGGDRVTLGGACARKPAGLAPRPTTTVVVGDELWGWTSGFEVVRYAADGSAAATMGTGDAFAPGGLCSVTGIAACGDGGVCVVDNNCMKVTRFDHDGGLVTEHPADGLFATRPYALDGAAAGADGALWIAAVHKDGARCEGAVYRIAAP